MKRLTRAIILLAALSSFSAGCRSIPVHTEYRQTETGWSIETKVDKEIDWGALKFIAPILLLLL